MKRHRIFSILKSKYVIAAQFVIIALSIIWFIQSQEIEPIIVIITALVPSLAHIQKGESLNFQIIEWDLRTVKSIDFSGKYKPPSNIIRTHVILENTLNRSILIKGFYLEATLENEIVKFEYASTGSRKDSFSKKDELKFIESKQVKNIWIQFSENKTNKVIDPKTISNIEIVAETDIGKIKMISLIRSF